jgi:RecJ-like exonuclease
VTFDEAARVLGVTLKGLTEQDVKIAYGRAVRLTHSDVGGVGGDMNRAKLAKDTLLKITTADVALDDACKQCKGTGSVRGSFVMAVCKTCNGSGKNAKDISGR